MNLVRKFYDTEVAEAGSGVVDIAAAMAKSGYNSDNRPEQQVEDKGNNEQEVETKEEVQTATVGTETEVETVVQEAETPREVETVTGQAQTQQQSWQEVLKQQQPETVLKELLGVDDSKIGFINRIKDLDPKMVAFLDTWESKGDVVAYLREMTTDYSKMSSEEVMRSQLRVEYPEASEKAIEALFKRKVVESYNLDADKYSDEEVEEGRLLLDAEADKYRKVLIAKQKDYVLPSPPEKQTAVPDNTENETLAKYEEYKAEVSSNPYIKDIFTNKQLSIGQGEERFNFSVEPSKITDVLFDNEKWLATMFDNGLDAKGNKTLVPKTQHQALVAAVAVYGMDFMNEYAKHFKTIGGKSVIDPIENAKPIGQTVPTSPATKPATAAEAMAKFGSLR